MSLPTMFDDAFNDFKAQTVDPDRLVRVQRALDYPKQVWYLVASFIALLSIFHLLVRYGSSFKKPVKNTRSSEISYQRIPLALLNLFRVLAFRITVPVALGGAYTVNIAEVSLTCVYIIVLFTWSFVNSDASTGPKLDPRFWANRVGNIAGSQLALMTCSWHEEQHLIFLTGDVTWDHTWIQCGLLASTSLSLLSILSLRPIREAGYESFKIMHTVFGVMFILSGYYHSNGLQQGFYVWPAILLWALDRFLRLARMIIFNWGYFNPLSKGVPENHQASVDVLSPHFLRVTMRRPEYIRWAPGQSVYLTIPSLAPLQAHPFTICTVDSPANSASATAITAGSAGSGSEKSPNSSSVENLAGKKLVFLVRVRNGFTRKLLNKVEDGVEGKSKEMKILLDGPYSSPPALLGFDRILLIAGGSGVAFTLPLLLDLLCKHLAWISEALLVAIQNETPSTTVDIRIHVTSTGDSWDDDSVHESAESNGGTSKEKTGDEAKLLSSPLVTFQQGRPDLKALVDAEIQDAEGPVSVNVCGTLALAAAVRSSLKTNRFMDILKGGPTVALHVEAFGAQ
ncbi:hypothetical protein C8J56DRAFT_972236, partial [Mycena floridula]